MILVKIFFINDDIQNDHYRNCTKSHSEEYKISSKCASDFLVAPNINKVAVE